MADHVPIDLGTAAAIHVIGCGGTGMAPITAVLAHMGVAVSGSDQRESATLTALGALGVAVTLGADYERIPADAHIVRSTAVPDTHPEVAAALAVGRPVLRRADALAAITRSYRTVAIAGTHGKTTTSAFTTAALLGAGLDVTSIVGGQLLGIDQVVPGAVLGKVGGVLVVESDESDGTFVELDAAIGVVTNIEPDHLEFYGGEAGLFAAFDRFIANDQLDSVVVCCDDDGVRSALDRTGRADTAIGYGQAVDATVRLEFSPPDSKLTIGTQTISCAPRSPGLHNALNFSAALSVAHALNLDVEAAGRALEAFAGVGRRFEVRGTANGIVVVDDYAHLHGEIEAAIRAAREVTSERVHVVFQPHRFSRTEALWHTYGAALQAADSVVVTDIFSSGESPRPGINADLVFDDLRRQAPNVPTVRVGPPAEVPEALAAIANPGDLCLLLSAGDLPTIVPDLLARLQESA